MINFNIVEELNSFTETITDTVCESVMSTSFDATFNDEWFVSEIRERVNVPFPIKQFFYLDFDIPNAISSINDETDNIIVTIALFVGDDSLYITADNSPVDGSPVGMHINIFLSDECDLKSDVNIDIFMFELENSIRHELEHILQEEFSEAVEYLDYHKIDFRSCKDPSNLCLYLVQPAEVSAHVRGYEKVSQTHFDFYRAVISLLHGYTQKGFLSNDEEMRVFLCWKDWFERNTYIKEKGAELCAK